MKQPPLIILGSPRSGTTFLGEVLSRHGDLAYAEEPRMIWRYGNDGRSDYLRAEDARPAVRESIHRAFDRLVEEQGKKRLLEKTPSSGLRLPFIDAVYPDAQYVHVLRNGYDAALSIYSYSTNHSTGIPTNKLWQRLKELKPSQYPHYGKEFLARVMPRVFGRGNSRPVWGPRLPGMAGMASELSALDIACLQWRACTEAGCQSGRQLPADRYMEIRLEDLDEAGLERIMAFANLPPDEAVLSHFRERFRPADPEGRRDQADPKQMARIKSWIEPTMLWLGYEDHAATTAKTAAMTGGE
ncbi:MAG: sulfotransferase [Planctomycetota bacterium]